MRIFKSNVDPNEDVSPIQIQMRNYLLGFIIVDNSTLALAGILTGDEEMYYSAVELAGGEKKMLCKALAEKYDKIRAEKDAEFAEERKGIAEERKGIAKERKGIAKERASFTQELAQINAENEELKRQLAELKLHYANI